MKRTLTILTLLCLLPVCALAQSVFKGKVTDTRGEPVPGVSVLGTVSGRTVGAITGQDGSWTLQTDPDRPLTFSCLGYETRQAAPSASSLIVLAEDTQMLQETVIVGFATQKKINLTGSVSTVESKQLENVPVGNAVLALQGQVPGLNIKQHSGQLYGRNPSMNLRGQGTIGEGSSGSMLVLIDGMEGDIYSINPQDIETISVLKDAAASSIYGSRAPFGVMLITTKRGKEGKVSVNYNNSFRFNSPLYLPSSADSYSWALYFNEAAHNDGNGDDISAARLQRIKDYQDGVISYNTIPVGKQWGTAYTEGNDNIDYYDVFWKDVTTAQEHNLSLSGGNAAMNYFVSANYLKEDGLLNWKNLDGLQRINVFGKVEAHPFRILDVSYSSRFIKEDYHEPTALTDDILGYFGQYLWPVAPLYDPNGILFNDLALRFTQGGQRTIANTTSTHQFNFTLKPLTGWRVVGDLNYRYRSYFNQIVDREVWQTCIDGVSKGSSWDYGTGVANDDGRNQYLNINLYTDYEKQLGGHYFKVLAGFQSEQYRVNSTYARKAGLIVPSMPSLDTTSGVLFGEKVSPTASGGTAEWRTAGFFGRINYNYKERYLLEANLRYDGSSRFAKASRWGLFPSVSIGYNIAKEPYFEPLRPWISTLKLRASYGSLGNQNTSSYYPTYEIMGYANAAGGWLIGGEKQNISWPAAKISSALTWEKIKSWNIGLDVSAFNDRLYGSVEFFIRRTEDMIGPADELPVIFGTAVPKTNNTDLVSRGFELEIGWKDRAWGQLDYGARFVLSDAVTKILRYSNPSKTLGTYYEGMTLGDFYGYETIGIARTDDEMLEHLITLPEGGQSALGNNWQAGDIMYRDLNGDGKIDSGSWTTDDHGDLRIIGNTTPRFNFGLDLTAAWKGLDLRIFFQGVGMRQYFEDSKYFFGSRGWSKWGTMVLKQHLDYFRDDPDNPLGLNLDSYYPRPYLDSTKNVQWQSMYVQDASYIRLKNLTLGYTLPAAFTQKFKVQALRVYFSGENLFTLTRMTDLFDPETIGENDGGAEGNGGSNVYPLTRTCSFGVSITF